MIRWFLDRFTAKGRARRRRAFGLRRDGFYAECRFGGRTYRSTDK